MRIKCGIGIKEVKQSRVHIAQLELSDYFCNDFFDGLGIMPKKPELI